MGNKSCKLGKNGAGNKDGGLDEMKSKGYKKNKNKELYSDKNTEFKPD